MAKQISVIKFVGRVGNIVGSRSAKGNAIFREYRESIANPQTSEQMDQRARFKLTSQVSGMLGEVGKLALKANGFRTTDRGDLNKLIMRSVSVENQVAKLSHVLNLVNNPIPSPFANDVTVAATVDRDVVTGTLTGLPEGTLVAKALLVFNPQSGDWMHVSALDTTTSISLQVPIVTPGDVYFYAQIVVPQTAEGRARLNNLIAQTPGYTLSVNRLDSSNFAYSRTLNAGIADGVAYTDTYGAAPENVIAGILGNMATGLQNAIDLGLANAAQQAGVTTNQRFITLNMDNVTLPSTIAYDQLAISEGTLQDIALGEADFTTPMQVVVPVDDPYFDERFDSKEDDLHIVVYSKTANACVISANEHRGDEEHSVSVAIPSHWQGHYVEVFAFLTGDPDTEVTAGKVSRTIYCGSGRIA